MHFDKYKSASQKYWERLRPSITNSGTIIVDLMHDNQWYLRLNLLIAKYLQILTGGRIVGVLHHWETPLVAYSAAFNVELAEAYDIDEVVDLDRTVEHFKLEPNSSEEALFSETMAGITQARSRKGHELRVFLQNLEFDGDDAFGRLSYDTCIRSLRCATIERFEQAHEDIFVEQLKMRIVVRRICDEYGIKASVNGHIEYAPYAFFAHEAIKAGGMAAFNWPLVPGTVRLFRDRESLDQCRSKHFVQNFNERILKGVDVNDPRVSRFQAQFKERFATTRAYQKNNLSDAASFNREEFLSQYGLDPSKRSAALLSQALSDAVHANGPMLFDDFGDWLYRTLQNATESGKYNLLLKVHPRDRTYSRDGFIGQLIREFDGAPNIAVLPRTVENAEIVSNCDIVSTVHGTPGYELAQQGIKTAIAGHSRYSGLGIAIEPTSIEAYFDELANGTSGGVQAEQARAALLFAYAEFSVLSARTPYVRTDKIRVPRSSPFWLEETQSLASLSLEDDPLFLALSDMIANGETHMWRSDFL